MPTVNLTQDVWTQIIIGGSSVKNQEVQVTSGRALISLGVPDPAGTVIDSSSFDDKVLYVPAGVSVYARPNGTNATLTTGDFSKGVAGSEIVNDTLAALSPSQTVKTKAARLLRGYREARPNALFGGTGYTATVALGAAGAASAIASPAAIAINAQTSGFRSTYDRNGGAMRSASVGSRFTGRRIVPSTQAPATHGYGVGIWTMAPQVELALVDFTAGGLASSVLARVNGEWVNNRAVTALPGLGSTNVHRYLLSFLDVYGQAHTAPRYVEFFLPFWAEITGINVSQNHFATVGPAMDLASSRIGFITNSYGVIGPVNPRNTPPHQIGERFGWSCDSVAASLSGSGYATTQNVGPSSSAVKFIDLVPSLAQFGADGFDAIVGLGGLTNDGGQSVANITAECTAFWSAVATAFPGTPLVCTGPFRWTGNSMSADRIAAEKAAFQAATLGHPAATYLDSYALGWQDPSISANYAADNQHPSDVGGIDLGAKVAPAIAAWLQTKA